MQLSTTESTLHLVLRLRGGPPPVQKKESKQSSNQYVTEAPANDDDQFESLDASQMSGLAEHVVYNLTVPTTIPAKESALVTVAKKTMRGDPVLYYDPKINDLNALRAIHLYNDTTEILAPGSIAVLENGRFVSQNAFTPMLPGDDQLINYGYDSTLSISKSFPAELQEVKIESSQIYTSKTESGVVIPAGVDLVQRHSKGTKYTIRNNSTTRNVEKFYIDHVADSSLGGYVIVTKDQCTKSVTGFSRFQLSLAPLQTIEFTVKEEATSTRKIGGTAELEAFLDKQVPVLLIQGIVSKQTAETVQAMIKRQVLASALNKMVQEAVYESDMPKWQALCTDGKLSKTLLAKASKILELMQRVTELSGKIDETNTIISNIFTNQERLRSNIKSLEKIDSSDLMKRYLRDLNKEEDDLLNARTEISTMQASRVNLNKEIKDLRNSLSTEAREAKKILDQGFDIAK
jgi:hypothetical protein